MAARRRCPAAPVARVLLLALLLLLAPAPGRAKRKKAAGKATKETHARLIAERERLVSALAKLEDGCDAVTAGGAPAQSPPAGRPVMQPAQLAEFAERGYTIVRALVPADVATGPCARHRAPLTLAPQLCASARSRRRLFS
jgi:hypothetical protein